MLFTQERLTKLKDLVASRQFDLTVVLENVHDPHNLGAIIRTCEAVGVYTVYVVYSETGKNSIAHYIGKRASRGAKRWVKVEFFETMAACIQHLRANKYAILTTHLSESAKGIYETDFTQKCAIVFGNEKDGISQLALQLSDANIIIPTYGMVQSLNVSVACAVTMFEASRQRRLAGSYNKAFDISNPDMKDCILYYVADQHPRIVQASPSVLDEFVDSLG